MQHARKLKTPDNIIPVFIPPYSPELNPAERVWQYLKDQLCHKVFKTLEEIQNEMDKTINSLLTTERTKTLTGYELYINAFL